jgi:ABC-type glycerol-3-phosphate transport system substrate-binding protein
MRKLLSPVRSRDTLRRTLVTGVALGLLAPAMAGAQEKVIQVWHTEPNPATKAVMDEIIAEFTAMHPDVRIEHEAVGWGDLDLKMQAALAAGAPPTLTQGQTYVERSLAAKGMLAPLNEVYESIGEDDIFDVIRFIHTYPDGNHYGLSHAVGTDTIIYRKDHYRDAGLDPDRVPATWEEWLADLKALTRDTDGDGRIDRYGLGLAGPSFFINEDLYMWVGSNGGRLFAENGRPTFTEPEVIETLAFWKELQDCCLPPDWLSQSYLDTFANLATGQVSSILGWGRGTGYFEQYAPDVVEAGDIGVYDSKPAGPSGEVGKYVTQFDNESWIVFKDSPTADLAIEFLKFFYERDNYLKYVESVPTHLLPVRKSIAEDPEYLDNPAFEKWDYWVQAQLKIIAEDDPRPLLMSNWEDLKLPFLAEIAGSGILADMVTDVVQGIREPEAAAQRAQERAEELITQLGYRNW